MKNVIKEIGKNQILLLIVPNKNYTKEISKLTRTLSKKNKVCYVSLNRTYEALKLLFKKENIKSANCFIIDAITKAVIKTPKGKKDSVFVSSPAALTEMSLAITKIQKKCPEYLLFDSLSTLLIYEDASTVTRFVHSLISRVRVRETTLIFTILASDKNTSLVKNMSMLVDKVIEID